MRTARSRAPCCSPPPRAHSPPPRARSPPPRARSDLAFSPRALPPCPRHSSRAGLLARGPSQEFESLLYADDIKVDITELPAYLTIGIVSGLAGTIFVRLNQRWMRFRKVRHHGRTHAPFSHSAVHTLPLTRMHACAPQDALATPSRASRSLTTRMPCCVFAASLVASRDRRSAMHRLGPSAADSCGRPPSSWRGAWFRCLMGPPVRS